LAAGKFLQYNVQEKPYEGYFVSPAKQSCYMIGTVLQIMKSSEPICCLN
jgi:hypothetical protein